MMFNVSNCKSENPMFCKKFIIHGDSVSTILWVDLAKSPVGMTFIGDKFPAHAFLRQSSGRDCEVFLSMKANLLQFEFPIPPANGERIEIDLEFYYEGELCE